MRDHDSLVRYLVEMAAVPFTEAGGDNDCGRFAAGAVQAQTGRNPLGKLHWTTPRGAARMLRRHGGIEGLVTALLGPPIAPSQAQRGDIAGLPEGNFGLLLMVVEGAWLIGPGNTRAPRGAMVRAWRAC